MSAIHSLLPPSVSELCCASDLAAVRAVFVSRPDVWIRADEVAKVVGWPHQRTAERVRRVVKELQELGVCIVHGPQGFKLTVDAVEIWRAARDIEAREFGLARTKRNYVRMAELAEKGQLSLGMFSAPGGAEVSYEG